MTKVYGTGAYDFKRHHVAEFPVEIQTQLSHKPVESKPGSTLPNSITLLEIQRDRLTKIAAANWLKTGGGSSSMQSKQEKNEFDPELVEQIYETELKGKDGNNTVPLQRVMILEGRELSIAEKTNYLVFMINAFQSLEDEIVSETVLKLGSLQSWYSLSYGQFQVLDFQAFPQRSIVSEDGLDSGFKEVDAAAILYCERYLRPLVADVAVVAKCHLSSLYRHEKWKLFAQLVDLLQFYERFEINDHVGTQLTDDEVLQSHYDHFHAFQLLAFKKIRKLRELALSNIGAIHKLADLSKKLSVLSPEELKDLVCFKLKLVSDQDPWSKRVDFLIEVMVYFFEKQKSQKEAINALPLYPNEQIMWDKSIVPSINYSGEGCLALPKLNLQFLTLHDYLLRNFNLFQLESTYDIREDIQEAVPHLLA
ncbi:hypothetical protein GH714_036895 [Hevea brasiliensis]|uniref:RNA helicase aquarius N-terminal domain-containing protein n=1 Tax=Hevea brasiliensis TaxID=3981 RepID=A0A6A6NF87_HEVBR|nr:hypothetical protein GH714_036895 [Hevea brasiliensis]